MCHHIYAAYVIDGISYDLVGKEAIVAGVSDSNQEAWTIPSTVTYSGLEYEVTTLGVACFENDKFSSISLPNSLRIIESDAFLRCSNLTSIVIPRNVISMSNYNSSYSCFRSCNLLRTIYYTSKNAPKNWVATSETYVPDLQEYSQPIHKMNNYSVIEMISFAENEFAYSGQPVLTTWTNNVSGYSVSLTMPTLQTEVGSYEEVIPATFTKGEESFSADVVYRYTIKPATLTAKVGNASREYGEENPQFSISYIGFVNGENEDIIESVPSVSTTATQTSDVGEYPITIRDGQAQNYTLVYEPGILTITKAPLTAKVSNGTKFYGASNPTFTIDYQGLKNGETMPTWITAPTFQTEATKSSGTGQYEVTAINGNPKNYELTGIQNGVLTITPAPLTIKALNASRLYHEGNPEFRYNCSGFVNSENESVLTAKPTLSTTAELKSKVGSYEIAVTGAESVNYSISYESGELTILPRNLTAKVENYERTYGEENPEFEVKIEGFASGEDESVLTQKPTASTPATKNSDTGTYTIKVSGGSADNYDFTYTSGTLTINKAEQTISWEQDLSNVAIGDQIELSATATSGLPITYTMENSDVAELYTIGKKTYLDCKAGGRFSMRAVQNGDKNYYSSPRLSKEITIVGSNASDDPTLTIKQADNGCIRTYVTKGSVYTFTIAVSEGWKIHTVSFNEVDVTGLLTNDKTFTTSAIEDDSTLSVVYEQDVNDGITAPNTSKVKIQTTSSGIKVSDAEIGDTIRVFTTDGILIRSEKVDNNEVNIPLTTNGVYIVTTGMKTVKLSY